VVYKEVDPLFKCAFRSPPKSFPTLMYLCMQVQQATMNLNALYGSIFLTLLYFLYQIIYRLWLSPIANIPGPKLAAATGWYEFYHDIINYGKYIFKVRDLHKKYGPIVRISPYEVHLDDPEFFDTLYAASNANRKDRWIWYTKGLGIPLSTLATVEQVLHRRRRTAMSPFFSKQNIRKLEPRIEERASTLVSRLEGLAVNRAIVPINLAFSAYTNGMILNH
jgi:Cytochrome P450